MLCICGGPTDRLTFYIFRLSAASTASCVEALPKGTPSIVRGLWRQVLTSIFFSVLTFALFLHGRLFNNEASTTNNEKESLISNEGTVEEEGRISKRLSKRKIALVAVAVFGNTLLNDAIIIALQYASSAAVMCLCNTSKKYHISTRYYYVIFIH